MNADVDPAEAILDRPWSELTAGAARMVADADERVVRWVWATASASWERVEPFWPERRHLAVSKKPVPSPSGELGYLVHYGYDEQGRIRLARRVRGGTVDAPLRDRDHLWVNSPDGRLVMLEYRYDTLHGVESVLLERITVPSYDGDELREVLRWGYPGVGGSGERERYEHEDGRIVRIVEDAWKAGSWSPQWEYECRYADGELASVIATRLDEPGGKPIVTYRRSSPAAVRAARKRIEAELPARIAEWVLRVAPDEPIFALALLYSFDDAAMPPAIGLATERERLALLASARDDARDRIWNPAEWEILESKAPELLADDLDACWQHLAQEWEQASDDRQPRALLVKVAKTLVDPGVPGLPRAPRAIYAVDDELVDLDRNLKATVPGALRKALEATD